MRSLYDESMAHQDYQIGRLVERLKAAGEWENTLLIVAADHSVTAALWGPGCLGSWTRRRPPGSQPRCSALSHPCPIHCSCGRGT